MATRTKPVLPYKAVVLSTIHNPGAPRRKSQAAKWLWEGYLPASALGVFDGDPGLGKSMVSLDLASRVSRGAAWPDNSPGGTPADVLIVASEDTAAEMADRLANHGADLTKITLLEDIGGRIPEFPRDGSILEAIIRERKAKLVIIDPIMVYLGVTSAQDQQVRKAVSPLAHIAQRTGATIIMIRHLTKTARNAKQAGGGSMGLLGQCRFGYFFGADSEDPRRRVMATTKMNVAAEPVSRAFRVETHHGLPLVVWEEKPEERLSADDLMRNRAVDTAERNEREMAVAFLRDQLDEGGGIAWPKAVLKAGAEAGFTQSQLRTAKKKLRLVSRKTRDNWIWCYPDHDPRAPWLSVVS